MAKKKKTKKTGKRRGLGSMRSSDKVKKALTLLTGIVSSNLTHEGLSWLSKQEFMAPAADSTSKINIKQAGLDGGLLLAAGAGAVMIDNDYVSAALGGAAITASMFLKEDLVKPALGLGALDDYLELYKSNNTVRKDLNIKGPDGKKPVNLAGPNKDNPIRL